MCLGCWEEEGRPFNVTDIVRKWAPKFAEADNYGPLHIVVDDWNLDDENLEFCRALPESKEADLALIDAMKSMTWEERWATAILAEDPEFDPSKLDPVEPRPSPA